MIMRRVNLLLSAILVCFWLLNTGYGQVPINRDNNGDLNYDNGGSFQSSGLTIDVRRFASIPDTPDTGAGSARPRLNCLTFANGIEVCLLLMLAVGAQPKHPLEYFT